MLGRIVFLITFLFFCSRSQNLKATEASPVRLERLIELLEGRLRHRSILSSIAKLLVIQSE